CNLRKKKFELALILHPTNRVRLVTFFARIPKRVGYDRKLGFLLTDKVKHAKHLGEKHELEYNLDLVRYLGIEPQDTTLFMPIRQESEKWADELFKKEGIKEGDKLLALHPGASCPSKIWPHDRFAQTADSLAEKYGFKVIVVAGPKDIKLAQNTIKHMRQQAIDLAAKTSISQLASILKRCSLFISNDSGPVHMASALNTPVISIFGRNQAGLSPKRWGPTGKRSRILHKEVGCIECIAHNCVKDFICLKAITVEDVVKVAEEILTNQ
ncbi:MAG: glycosyltransferase family 9 protein, partial [Candidatus Omnitrophica bacterium]|nr:glycosyltransferase family 9 protein [Candidatus Omnitrophota bacterium]